MDSEGDLMENKLLFEDTDSKTALFFIIELKDK
jgi:hypothetical protein